MTLTPIQELSIPLAKELMPEAVAEMQAEIARLQRLLFVEPAYRKAVIRFVEERREDVCTDWEGNAVTLHTLAESNTPVFAEVVDRMLSGDLTGLWLLCPVCTAERCRCKDDDVLSPEERFAQQIPNYLHDAMERLLEARGTNEEKDFI